MACIADWGFVCECGSKELAAAPAESGRAYLCPKCARAYLGPNAPIAWSVVERELRRRYSDRFAFGWLRSGVALADRREVPEPSELTERRGRFAAAERKGALLGAVLVVLMLLSVARAVWS